MAGIDRALAGLFAVSAAAGRASAFLESASVRKGRSIRANVRFSGAPVRLELRPLGDHSKCPARSRHIEVSCSGKAAGRALGLYLQLVARRLGDRTFREVCDLTRGAGGAPSSDTTAFFLGGAAGNRRGKWWNFFADMDFRNEEYELVWTGRALTVALGEKECFFARPPSDFRRWSFLNYPHMGLPGGGPSAVRAAEERVHRDVAAFDLDEREIVMGTRRKEDEIVESLRPRAGEVDVLLTCGSCTTVVMGMDAKALSRRCGQALGCEVIERGQTYREDLPDSVAEIFRGFLEGAAPARRVPDPRAVNLYDFPPGYREEELAPLLAEMGLQPRLRLLPEVGVGDVRRIPEALWQIAPETSSRARSLPALFARKGLRSLSVPAPYGVRNTRRCLETIARRTGTHDAFLTAWRRRWAVVKDEWRELRRQAQGYRLAFVVHGTQRLSDPVLSRGIPFIPLLREMGFGVDVLVLSGGEEPSGSPPDTIDGVRLFPFSTPGELERLLREVEFRAVFSDIFFDWRLTEAGKSQFSQRHFEMGLDGALRSLRGLIAVCRLPFYERYASYLPRRPRGEHG